MSTSLFELDSVREFKRKLEGKSREELLEIIQLQHPEYIEGIEQIENVFRTKLRHLTWKDGSPITSRPFTNQELASLIDPPFIYDKNLYRQYGLTEEKQRNIHISSDPVLWAYNFLGLQDPIRVYQLLVLRDQNPNRVMRFGRRSGKTFTLALYALWYSFVTKNGRVIIMTPMKTQSGLIYEEIIKMAKTNGIVESSITRNVSSPQYEINFSNGSTIRLFTTGMKSGNKADVVRGQEAHVIIMDEMDYMGEEDHVAILPMLLKTGGNQREKVIIGSSTPTGQRKTFYKWCHDPEYSSFWFPSYCIPYWEDKEEQRVRSMYTENNYRHEYEADWGEDEKGVYPRKYVDIAFDNEGWDYIPDIDPNANSFYLMGVDWDKYAADGGVNIVVLQYCDANYPDERWQGKLRLVYHEEMLKEEYLLHRAVDRIIELNNIFKPQHIYVDKGYGEMQIEYLHKHGIENPKTGLHKKARAWHFNEAVEVPDPYTKEKTKQFLKPFMVENLRWLLEKEKIVFSNKDEKIYLSLISYIVTQVTETGRPKFASGNPDAPDHMHDALILACLAFTYNYDKLVNPDYTMRSKSVSNEAFLPLFALDTPEDREIAQEKWEDSKIAPVISRRAMTKRSGWAGNSSKAIKRKMF